MKAVCWYGTRDVRVETVPDPQILNSQDAIIRITTSAICGSDLHLYDGYIPTMKKGDILGHEMMGEVVEVGRDVKKLKAGDRVVVPFNVVCGSCWFCKKGLWSLCDNSNPNASVAEMFFGQSVAAAYGYSHMMGGYAGGQAQYARVPFADAGPIRINNPDLPDDKVVFLSDIFPTGYMAAENCNIQPGDVIAIWGCGPVGQFAIRSAYMLGAERVIALDNVPARLSMAERGKATVLNYEDIDVVEKLKEMTGGRGPDACIDAVGMEAHGGGAIDAIYDRAKQALMMETDRPHVLRQCIQACRKGGTVSVAGVYGGLIDKFPMGAAFQKGLTFKMGQTHVPRYMGMLLERIERGDIDPSFVITHRIAIDDAPNAYETFRLHKDGAVKYVIKPN